MAGFYKDFYWITPKGEVIRPKDEEFHYELILSHPEVFGYKDKEEALKFKNSHGGDADSLRIPAIAQGFIRIRMRGGGLCIIQVVKFNEEIRKILRDFIIKEDVFQNLTVELKNVDAKVLLTGKILDLLKEDDIPSYDKNTYPPPRDTEEGRKEKRKLFESINFDDTEKYKHFAKGNFTFHKNVATVEKYDDIDLTQAQFSDIVML